MCNSYRDLSAHPGGLAGLVLPLSKCLVNRDSESDRVFLGEGISFVDRKSLSWAKLRRYKLLRAVPAVMWQLGIC